MNEVQILKNKNTGRVFFCSRTFRSPYGQMVEGMIDGKIISTRRDRFYPKPVAVVEGHGRIKENRNGR